MRQTSVSIPIGWAGTDQGSGILDYSIYLSTDGGPSVAFSTDTTDTSAIFTADPGKRYALFSIARDRTGNVEAKSTPDTVTGLFACPGDCDYDATVIISELVTGVNIALERTDLDNCAAFDLDDDAHS